MVPELSSVRYTDILKLVGNFVSLDISVRSTGWCKWLDGRLTYGIYSLEQTDELLRRQEFKTFLRKLLGTESYDFVAIEDTIGGKNYKTTKGLIQLNTILDDMVYDKIFDIKQIRREDNGTWKRFLRELTGYEPTILAERDKALIVGCMHELGFDLTDVQDIPKNSKQDIYDALGLAMAVIYKFEIKKQLIKGAKLKTDITKGYKIKQFDTGFNAMSFARKTSTKLNKEIKSLEMLSTPRDLVYNFKTLVNDIGDDKVFVIKIKTEKLGVLALKKKFDLTKDISYIVCYR